MSQDAKKRRRGLGKGLSALLPQDDQDSSPKEFDYLLLSKIVAAKDQPRKHFDEDAIKELADSIKHSGLIQPLVVRQVGDYYELIAGERRYRACQSLELERVPVVIKELTDQTAFTLALVENLQREDLSPIEQANAFQRLVDEFKMTQQEVADAVGKSRAAVANSIRLLKLPPEILAYIEDEVLTAGHARTLVSLDHDDAIELAQVMVRHGFSVREAEEFVREQREKDLNDWEETEAQDLEELASLEDPDLTPVPPAIREALAQKSTKSQPLRSNDVDRLTTILKDRLGTKVSLVDKGGKGRLILHYEDLEMLQQLLERVAGTDILGNLSQQD